MSYFCMTCKFNFETFDIVNIEYDGKWYEVYFRCLRCGNVTQVSTTDLNSFPPEMKNFIDIYLSVKGICEC